MSEQERRAFLGSSELLSIGQAAELTPYSPEYLSLLARKGKLPAVKIARNWLTTRDAVRAYLKQQRQHQQGILKTLVQSERRMR
jgi:excisionase family DNA binding protein